MLSGKGGEVVYLWWLSVSGGGADGTLQKRCSEI